MKLLDMIQRLQSRLHQDTCCQRVLVKVPIPGTNGLWFEVTDVSTFTTSGPLPADGGPAPVVEQGVCLYVQDPEK